MSENEASRRARQEQDIRELESGGLPSAARERCARLAENGGRFFTSTFSVPEFLCAQSTGVSIAAEVMGSAIITMPANLQSMRQYLVVRPGYNDRFTKFSPDYGDFNPNTNTGLGRASYSSGSYWEPLSGELYEFSTARLDARQKAISRMKQEAELLGASGIIGVRVESKVRDWGAYRSVEFTALGTAIRIPGHISPEPFTSLLSGQEFWQLWQAGFEPKGIALGVCSYTDASDSATINQRLFNQEIGTYTNCFYEARRLAMESLIQDVRHYKAAGAIGVQLEYDFQDLETEIEINQYASVRYYHLITNFSIMGTAISRRTERNSTPAPAAKARPVAIFDLRSLPKVDVDFDRK